MAPRINQISTHTHTLEEEPLSWQFVPPARRIPSALNSNKHLQQHRPVSCVGGPQLRWRVAGATLPHWRPMWGPSDQGGTQKGCPKLHWSHQPRQRTATSAPAPPERQRRPAEERGGSAATATGNRLQLASPGSSLEQPRPAAPLPGDQEPKAPCSRRRWGGGGIMPRRPGGGGDLQTVPGPPRSYLRGPAVGPPRAHPASPCNQLAQRHLRQLKQQPQASGLRDGGGGWGWRVTLGRCGGSGVWGGGGGGGCVYFLFRYGNPEKSPGFL